MTAQKLNFDSIRNMVHSEKKHHITVDQLKFSRDASMWLVKTEIIKKKYGFVFDKRVIKEDFSTLPYGF